MRGLQFDLDMILGSMSQITNCPLLEGRIVYSSETLRNKNS